MVRSSDFKVAAVVGLGVGDVAVEAVGAAVGAASLHETGQLAEPKARSAALHETTRVYPIRLIETVTR